MEAREAAKNIFFSGRANMALPPTLEHRGPIDPPPLPRKFLFFLSGWLFTSVVQPQKDLAASFNIL